MIPEDKPHNPKPERRYYDDDESFEMAMWVWKQEVKNARAAARFNKKVDDKFTSKPASDGESAINPSNTTNESNQQPTPTTPTKQERVKARAEIKNDTPPSATPDPATPSPTKTTNNVKIEDIKPQSEKTRSKRRSPLGPIKRELANISKNASTSARNSGVIRTQILGPISERLANLASSVRSTTTRINQSERNLEEKIGKVSGIVKEVRSENGKLFDRIKSLRIGNISRGVAKVRKRIEGINERTKIINKNVKVIAAQSTDVEPQHQPGIMERAWAGLGTRLGLVKRPGNAALKNVRGTGNKAKIKSLNPRMSKIPDPGELPSQLGIEAKNIYDRYTSPWSTGTKSRILANMVMPGVTALPALARSITGTSKGRGLFKKRNKGQQEVSNTEKAEIKQDKSEQAEDLFEKLKNTVFKVRIVNSDGEDVVNGAKGRGTKLVESEDSDSLLNRILSKLGLAEIMGLGAGGAGVIGTATAVAGMVVTAAAAVGAGTGLGLVLAKNLSGAENEDRLNSFLHAVSPITRLLPDITDIADKGGEMYAKWKMQSDYEKEAEKAYLAGLRSEKNPSPPSNPLSQMAYDEGIKNKDLPEDKRKSADDAVKDLKTFLGNMGLAPGIRNYSPKVEIQSKENFKPLSNDNPLKTFHGEDTTSASMFNMMNKLYDDTSKKIDDNTKPEPSATPINVNSVSTNVSTNNSSPTLLAPQSMFDAKQSYSRFGWLYA